MASAPVIRNQNNSKRQNYHTKPIKRHTISGFITDNEGETLLNATVFDSRNNIGTTTNSHGFYSLSIPEGKVSMKISYVGYKEKTLNFILKGDTTITFTLSPNTTLNDIYVDAENLQQKSITSQTGYTRLTAKEILSVPAALSTPDLIRRLQLLPGVASGMELVSGIYVRGGNSDENLFMIDGNPIYQINHLGGLFSAFNTDAIKTVDFFKGGFPAQYGGRLSSVVNVRTKDGSMNGYHGTFSIGLLEGRIQFEGPVVKDRTSFNISLRRSWLDILLTPSMAIYNLTRNDEISKFGYAFHDLNAKLTHKFSETNKLSLSIYSGNDVLRTSNVDKEAITTQDEDKMFLGWGNTVSSLNWNYVFRPNINGDISIVFSQFRTKIREEERTKSYSNQYGEWTTSNIHEAENRTRIIDFGYRADFDYRPSAKHNIRFGSNYLFHIFKPQYNMSHDYSKDENTAKELVRKTRFNAVHAHEISVYIEDEISVMKRWKLNLGARGSMFNVGKQNYWSFEPRLNTRISIIPERLSFKASYTEMSQYVHTLSTTYLSLPSDMWVPVTERVKPARSRLISSGFSMKLPFDFEAEAEGYYKTIDNIIDYRNIPRLTANFSSWEDNVISGKGRSYGLELALRRKSGNTYGEFSYTLSWNERKFDELWENKWFPAKFDNRHKLNISVAHRINKKIELSATWIYSTGNRVTVALENYESRSSHSGSITSTNGYYEHPNNVRLPAYHRLDIGMNIYKKTKRGNEGIWNISIYNAYCRLNPLRVKVVGQESGYYENGNIVQKPFRIKAEGLIPIIPSFSYTLKF